MNLLGFNEDIIEHVIILGDRMGFDGDIMVKNIDIYIYIHNQLSLCKDVGYRDTQNLCFYNGK